MIERFLPFRMAGLASLLLAASLNPAPANAKAAEDSLDAAVSAGAEEGIPSPAPSSESPAFMGPVFEPEKPVRSETPRTFVSPTEESEGARVEWREVRRLELAYQALNVIDAIQTINCVQSSSCHEGNPLFGANPGTLRIVGIKAGMGITHLLIARALYKHDPSKALAFSKFSMIIQGGVVGLNARFMF